MCHLLLNQSQILNKLSEIFKIPVSKIGLKATTSEQIGIIGENTGGGAAAGALAGAAGGTYIGADDGTVGKKQF